MKVLEKNVRINICTKNLNNGTLQYDLKLDWLGNGAHTAAVPLVLLDAALIYNFLLWGILVHLTKWFLRLGSRDRIVRFFTRWPLWIKQPPWNPHKKGLPKGFTQTESVKFMGELLPLLCTWLTFSAARSYSHVYCRPFAIDEIFRNGILRAPRWLISACCEKNLGIIEDSWIPVVSANFRHDVLQNDETLHRIEEMHAIRFGNRASFVFLSSSYTLKWTALKKNNIIKMHCIVRCLM